jgi:hypothetical protein
MVVIGGQDMLIELYHQLQLLYPFNFLFGNDGLDNISKFPKIWETVVVCHCRWFPCDFLIW